LIYLIAFAFSESGSVDREHNVRGTPILEVDLARAAADLAWIQEV